MTTHVEENTLSIFFLFILRNFYFTPSHFIKITAFPTCLNVSRIVMLLRNLNAHEFIFLLLASAAAVAAESQMYTHIFLN